MKKDEQTFYAKVKDGKLDFYDKTGFIIWLELLEGKEVDITIAKEVNRRTKRQNNALHLYFQLLANELNEAGLDMRKVLKKEVDIDWTGLAVKEYLWRPIQKAKLKKTSTTKLTTSEVDKVWETLNRFLGEKLKVHVPFPSLDDDRF